MKHSSRKIKLTKDKYIYCLLTCSENLEKTVNIYKHFIARFLIKHRKFTIYNFNNSKNKSNFKIYNLFKNKNLEIKNIKNKNQFLNEIKDKQLFAVDAIGKSLLNFKERLLINKKNIHLIFIMNIGFISNEDYGENIDLNLRNQAFRLLKYLNKFIFRILILLNIFPKTKFYFDSRKQIVDKLNNSIVRRLIVKYPILKFLLNYHEVEKINCNAYESYRKFRKKNKSGNIIFIDGNYKHQDMLIRDGKKILHNEKKYLFNLKRSLKFLEKFFKRKVEIMLHPSTNFKDYRRLSPFFKINKGNTDKKIYNSSVVVFHESSSVIDAVISRKKIISFDTSLLGNYLKSRINLYKDEFKTFSIDIDNLSSNSKDFKNIYLSEINDNKKQLKKYVSKNLLCDGKILPSIKINNRIQKFIEKIEN